MKEKISFVIVGLLFCVYNMKGQIDTDPLRYDADDPKRISYGDSTWITKKDNSPEGELIYSSITLGKPFVGFRVLCGWLREQDIRNHFSFYYKESNGEEWKEVSDFKWDVRTYPSPWYQVSYAYGEFPNNKEISYFKIKLKETFYNNSDWDMGYNTLLGRVVLFTKEYNQLDIDSNKQYAISNKDGYYWIEDSGYIIQSGIFPKYGGEGAWRIIRNEDFTYTVKSADESVELSFDYNLNFYENQFEGILTRFGNEHRYSHTENDVQKGSDDRFLIERIEGGKYTFRRAHDGRAIGIAEGDILSGNKISVKRGKPEALTLTEISDPSSIKYEYKDNLSIIVQSGQVKISGLERNSKVQIFQISGLLMLQETVNVSNVNYFLENGVYIINVVGQKASLKRKVIIK